MLLPEVSQPVQVEFLPGVKLQVIPHPKQDFLISSVEAAKGFGVDVRVLRDARSNHDDEFVLNRHFLSVEKSDAEKFGVAKNRQMPTFYTKRGIIRLSFFIKSGRAKQMRDAAEDCVYNALVGGVQQVMDFVNSTIPAPGTQLQLPMMMETVRVLPNELYEELIRIESKKQRMKLLRLYKELAAKGAVK